jgi:hypothetical protein
MALGVANTDLLDLLKTTLENLPKNDFEYALKYQQYLVINNWFAKEKVQIDSGTQIKRNIVLSTTGNARHVRLFQKTPLNVGDTQQQLTCPWVQVQTHHSYERRELLRNQGAAGFVELIDSRRKDALMDLANLLERAAIRAPNTSTDDLNPRGLFYWLSLRNTGSQGEGFDGQTITFQDASTSTTKGGIDASTSANALYRNYAATYNDVNTDFLSKLRKAFYLCNFKPPVTVPGLKATQQSRFQMYTGIENLTAYDDLVAENNDNMGADLGKFGGQSMFRGVAISYMPTFDESDFTHVSYRPWVGINHSKFYPVVQKGDWMRDSEPVSDAEQHNVFTVFMDGSYNFLCINPREAGFVLHTPN